MSAADNGGPAFPCSYVLHKPGEVGNQVPIMANSEGATMRDYFAGLAMQGLIASNEHACKEVAPHEARSLRALIVRASYDVADEMLKARQS